MKDEPTPLRAARDRLSARLCCLAVALSLALVGCTPAVDASPWENATATGQAPGRGVAVGDPSAVGFG